MVCPRCGTAIANYDFCPTCGYDGCIIDDYDYYDNEQDEEERIIHED
jgi:uncharacterized Zn finger protein (UPF0148 family)